MAEGRLALVHMNALRIRHQNKLKEEDFEQYLEDQPIVVEDLSAALSASITFATGAGIGTGIGAAILVLWMEELVWPLELLLVLLQV